MNQPQVEIHDVTTSSEHSDLASVVAMFAEVKRLKDVAKKLETEARERAPIALTLLRWEAARTPAGVLRFKTTSSTSTNHETIRNELFLAGVAKVVIDEAYAKGQTHKTGLTVEFRAAKTPT